MKTMPMVVLPRNGPQLIQLFKSMGVQDKSLFHNSIKTIIINQVIWLETTTERHMHAYKRKCMHRCQMQSENCLYADRVREFTLMDGLRMSTLRIPNVWLLLLLWLVFMCSAFLVDDIVRKPSQPSVKHTRHAMCVCSNVQCFIRSLCDVKKRAERSFVSQRSNSDSVRMSVVFQLQCCIFPFSGWNTFYMKKRMCNEHHQSIHFNNKAFRLSSSQWAAVFRPNIRSLVRSIYVSFRRLGYCAFQYICISTFGAAAQHKCTVEFFAYFKWKTQRYTNFGLTQLNAFYG